MGWKRLSLAVVLSLASLRGLRADESVDIFKQIYATASTYKQKHFALTMLADTKDPIVAFLFESSLKELIKADQSEIQQGDREYFDALLLLDIASLGSFLHEESQDDLMAVAKGVFPVRARAEAIVALGRMRALAYVKPIAALLEGINQGPGADQNADEILANAAIIALGKMGHIDGWKPVFYATQGWYPSKIRIVADEILPVMMDDPSAAVLDVLAQDPVPFKAAALRYEGRSKAPRDRKIAVAVTALKAGTDAKAKAATTLDAAAAWGLRSLAMQDLVNLQDGGLEAVDVCKGLWSGAALDEKLLILTLYGANKRNEAAVELNSVLLDYNRQRADAQSDAELERLAKAAIQNAGRALNPKALPGLKAVRENSRWSAGVLLAAEDALKAILGN
jgi:hypothetical protein